LQWLQTEKTNKGAIQEQKIRCAYVAAEDGGAANGIPEEDEAHEASRLDESVSTRSVLSCFGEIRWETSMLEDPVGSAERGEIDAGTSDQERSWCMDGRTWDVVSAHKPDVLRKRVV
jgi:hypothetical protein